MDGTLLREDKTISDHTIEVVGKVKEKGTKVVLASGRPPEGLAPYEKILGLGTEGDYLSCFNGAMVCNAKTKEVISKIFLKGQDLLDLYQLSKELKVNIHCFVPSGCITPAMSTYTKLEADLNNLDVEIVDFDAVDPEAEVIKIMFVDEPEYLETVIAKLPQYLYDKYTVVRSAPFFIEFLNKSVNKGIGLSALATHLGVTREETMACGDAGNDFHMIQYAGMGVAMENAYPEVKAIANFITKSNEEDGVAYAMEKFILNV